MGWFSWGLVMATARAIQPSTGEGSQREGQSVNKTPLRKGAPLISQRGRLSREGGKGKHRGAAGCAGAQRQDPARGFLQAAQSLWGALGWITLPGGAWLPSQAPGCRTWLHAICAALPLR